MENFPNTHIRLPIKIGDISNDDIFYFMSVNENPMLSEDGQEWLKENGLLHTHMGVGDVIERDDGRFFVRDNVGWRLVE